MPTQIPASGTSIEPAVAISDVIRDPRGPGKLSNDQIAVEVRRRWEACINFSRELRLRQWIRNVLMVYSDKDVRWSRATDRYLAVEPPRRQYRNPLLPGRVALFSARMTQQAPEWTCIPSSDSIEDEETARFCERVLRYAYRELRVDLSRYFSVIQMCLFGFGLLKLYVDEEADLELEYDIEVDGEGKPIVDPQTGEPVYKEDASGRAKIKEVKSKPGPKIRPVSPFAFGVPPGLEWPLLTDSPYLIEAQWHSEAYIRERYEVSKDVTLRDAYYGEHEAISSYLWQVINSNMATTQRYDSGKILVLQYHEQRKNVEGFEEGKVYTVCGSQLIGNERALLSSGQYPFFMFPWMPMVDSFYPYPWINPQIDPQSCIDQTKTHLMNHLAKVGSPNLIAETNSGVPAKPAFNYSVFFIRPGMRRPEFMQAPSMPTGAYEMFKQSYRDLDACGNMYPLGRGESAQGVTSGLHARLIQDADQTEMGPIIRLHTAEFARMGEALLEVFKDFGPDDKMLALSGGDDCDYFAFKKGRIPLKQRVEVQEESLLVHYKSALEERATQLGNAGAFGNLLQDPQARETFRRAIRDPKPAGPLTPEQIQKSYLDKLHYKIIHEGLVVKQPEKWWNLNAHREAAFERLCRESDRWDPATSARFMGYWAIIEKAISVVEQQQHASDMQMASEQVALQGQLAEQESQAKAKIEYQKGVTKLAVESMKSPDMGAGAGGGSFSGGGTENDGENEQDKKEEQ